MSSLRYLAPNAVTSIGLLFGLLSLIATYEHRFVDAGWLIVWAVLVDRVDGFVARLLNATSDFGVQMDSFADAINFGVSPAFLVYVSLSEVTALGFDHGFGRVLLMTACALWVLANVFRLAKFNVVVEDANAPPVFFGVPTTLAAGVLVIWVLAMHKYSAPGGVLGMPEAFSGPRLFGSWTIPLTAWSYLPAAMLVGGFLMASNVPQPKIRRFESLTLTVFVGLGVFLGYVCGTLRFVPEFMVLMPSGWLLVSVLWGQLSGVGRSFQVPSFLPSPPSRSAASQNSDELGSSQA